MPRFGGELALDFFQLKYKSLKIGLQFSNCSYPVVEMDAWIWDSIFITTYSRVVHGVYRTISGS